MAATGGHRGGSGKLTQEGAAELYWEMLIRPLRPQMLRAAPDGYEIKFTRLRTGIAF